MSDLGRDRLGELLCAGVQILPELLCAGVQIHPELSELSPELSCVGVQIHPELSEITPELSMLGSELCDLSPDIGQPFAELIDPSGNPVDLGLELELWSGFVSGMDG